jgi:transglutaminase-like putative cysteine protease
MGIHVALKHRTHYRYEKPVVLGPQVVQLRPAPHCRVPILGYSLDVTPANHSVHWQVDPHSNRIARLLFPDKTNELLIEVNLVADLSPINPFDFLLDPAVEKYPFRYTPALSCDLVPFLVPEQPGPLLRHFLHGLSGQTSGTVDFLVGVNRKLKEEIAYETRHAPGVQSGEETLARRFGSCRDSAWLLVEILRNLGIAARFVSGYLVQLSGDGAAKPDSADLHSWTEAYLPGAGWIGLDPTSGRLAAEGHIPLMCSATTAQTATIAGTAEMLSIDFRSSVTVHRVEQRGSTKAPFSEPQWQRVRELARAVDRELAANDVRLMMGVEPAFVAIDEPPQGNQEALGTEKKVRDLAATWDELEQLNIVLDDEARGNPLTSDTLDDDGAHQAAGCGNHIVIGGASVTENPILRRPDLLRSLLTFWQNHPSLSYLFSGTTVGRAGRSPRVDEARMDALDELEIAFQQLPAGDCPPSIIDALFRNLLTDASGNTHRAEFCIDKLYPGEGRGWQRGLLEMHAFEMPPHVRMNLLQLLLVRALVCSFWKTPFEGELVRWGSALHHRFLLPHYVQKDLVEVLAHLRQCGFDFDEAWFAAHLQFRFPTIGTASAEGIELELRRALEPWSLLAEGTAFDRTVRNVGSALERIQVRVSGATPASRYVVTCNERRVPLQPTGEAGVSIAGVRYRARKQSVLLHPTIPLHEPLIFEMIDSWMNRAIAQCVYHVEFPHQDGDAPRPSEGAEAEQHRAQRFEVNLQPRNASPPPPEELNRMFPGTLDLRTPAPLAGQSYGNS